MNRRIGRVVATVIACGVVAGCFGGSEASLVGEVVTVFGPYRETEADRFGEVLRAFTEETGIEVRYTGTSNFVADLDFRLQDGNRPPDIALVPQPGLIRRLAADGEIQELPQQVQDAMAANYPDRTRALGAVDGRAYGVPIRVDVKSLVWYRPDVFAERGWTAPRSLDELEALVDAIVAERDLAPWCLALRAGVATGWPATDWVEDLVLRRSGPDVYRAWVAGEQRFDSPEIASAFDEFADLVLRARHVDGGPTTAIETTTDDVFGGLLAPEPRCAMVKQADFAAAWLPEGTEIGPDGDVSVFVLPDVSDFGFTPPLVVGADSAVAFDTDADTVALLTYLAGPTAGETWVADGAYISPKSSIGLEAYTSEFSRDVAAAALSSNTLVLDASDAMPASVGTTLYWSAITTWVKDQSTYPALATTLDEAFDAFLTDEADAGP